MGRQACGRCPRLPAPHAGVAQGWDQISVVLSRRNAAGRRVRHRDGVAAAANLGGAEPAHPSNSFSSDGTRLATSDDRVVRVWESPSGCLLHILEGHTGLVTSVLFSPDGTRLVSTSDNQAALWEVSTGRLLHTLEGHTNQINSMSFSPDGKRLITGSADRTARVWKCPRVACSTRWKGSVVRSNRRLSHLTGHG